MNWDDEIERLIKGDFFFKMGETEQIDHVIFIKNVNEAFINPTEEAFENLYKKMCEKQVIRCQKKQNSRKK